MPRLPDEQWVMIEDSIEKKSIARSSRGKRTHCGKRGGVKFPSDFMSKKELKAMNSEVKSYKIHDPMSWKEFLSLPDDLKKEYVKYIRERFKATDTALADAFGVSLSHFCKLNKKLGLPSGKSHSSIGKRWKKSEERKAFEKWWYRDKYEELTETTGSYEETNDERSSDSTNVDEKHAEYSDVGDAISIRDGDGYCLDFDNLIISHNVCSPDATPVSGNLSFDCEADSAFELAKNFLGSKKVHLYIEWTVKEN